MIKITIETDDPTSEAYQTILKIIGEADEVQLEDPLFPNQMVSSRWFAENWKAGQIISEELANLGKTPSVIRDLVRNLPRQDLPGNLTDRNVWEAVIRAIENTEMERAAKVRLGIPA